MLLWELAIRLCLVVGLNRRRSRLPRLQSLLWKPLWVLLWEAHLAAMLFQACCKPDHTAQTSFTLWLLYRQASLKHRTRLIHLKDNQPPLRGIRGLVVVSDVIGSARLKINLHSGRAAQLQISQ